MAIKPWIKAARLRTLPLAISTMIVGHSLAANDGSFKWSIATLSIVTAVILQILSNFSNDYGDTIHGADHAERVGPSRAVQSGDISIGQMKNAIGIFVFLSLVSGISLIVVAFDNWILQALFLAIGLIAIWAAINYTAGKKPYGYKGKGDIAVFIFFGIVTVLGSYFLQVQTFRWELLLPAVACGTLCVGVLNVNNIRDIASDKIANKQSVPVKIGREAAVTYHGALLVLSILGLVIFGTLESFGISFKWLFILAFPLLLKNFMAVKKYDDAKRLDPYLKQLALSSAVMLIIFSIGLVL